MKRAILNGLSLFKPILMFLFEIESSIAKKWVSSAHKRLMFVSWAIPKNPEYFDHQIDLFYQWQKNRISFWLERGVFGSVALKRKGDVLELACGDGFNARNFYSGLASKVLACDFDKSAISLAKRKNPAANVTYVLADIRNNMPSGEYDNVIWDGAIEHFTPEEILVIVPNIKRRLKSDGILSGYTIVGNQNNKSLAQHEYEFKSMADLKKFFTPHFKNVIVFETIFPQRHNLYFLASDGILPFSDKWEHWLKTDVN